MTRARSTPHRARGKRADGDVRYDPTITGYSHRRRARLRSTQEQVASLVTAIARDNGSAAMELTDDRLAAAIKSGIGAIREWRREERSPDDARPDLVHLAAVVTLWAEAIDVPDGMPGTRISSRYVAPDASRRIDRSQAAVPVPKAPRKRRRPVNEQQIALW